MVEAIFTFLQVEVEGDLMDAVELSQSALRVAPEGLDAVDVAFPPSKFILPMVHPAVLLEAHVHQAFVGLPAVAMDGASTLHMPTDKGQ